MSLHDWQIPRSMQELLATAPTDRAVLVLMRHSVRNDLPTDNPGNHVPITEIGHTLAFQLGQRMHGRVCSLHTSPILRCVQTAQALAAGAGHLAPPVPNRLLGDPGVFVLDGERAWSNWQTLGHHAVMHHLTHSNEVLPGMARPAEAARHLLESMLAEAGDRRGLHVFVTHDSVLAVTVARLLGISGQHKDWPCYLEGAFIWREADGICIRYREHQKLDRQPRGRLSEPDVLEFARREIAATVGLTSGAHFFLAGGAFKSLLTGRPPRDLDLWAASYHDRQRLIAALLTRGAMPLDPRPFADAFRIGNRVVEVVHKTEPATLSARLARFDLALSAIGVEHMPDDRWTVQIHPRAFDSIAQRQVLLLKPLVNASYALETLERMRRYADELSFVSPADEEDEIWRLLSRMDHASRATQLERYKHTGSEEFGVMEAFACRFP